MSPQELHIVTGAFGHSGKYIAARLLARGHRVRTLTNSGTRGNSFGGKVEVHPLAFDRPPALTDGPMGRLLYRLKRRWRNGTTHVIFEPLELVEKLAGARSVPEIQLGQV